MVTQLKYTAFVILALILINIVSTVYNVITTSSANTNVNNTSSNGIIITEDYNKYLNLKEGK